MNVNLPEGGVCALRGQGRGTSTGSPAAGGLCRPLQRGQVLGDQPVAQPEEFCPVGAAPGKTTHINYFLIDGAFYLVDLPGYGYAKVSQAEKARWGRLMEEWFADNS